MEAIELDLDKETTVLANAIKELLGAHMLKFSAQLYKEVLVSCLTALATNTGDLRALVVDTQETDSEKFDEIFLTAVVKRFDEQRRKYGGAH